MNVLSFKTECFKIKLDNLLSIIVLDIEDDGNEEMIIILTLGTEPVQVNKKYVLNMKI